MGKLLLSMAVLAASACSASADTLDSRTIESGNGLAGAGVFQSGVAIEYTLDFYERENMPVANLGLPAYFRYSYVFSAPGDFFRLLLGLPEDCGADNECVFGIETEGTSGGIELFSNNEAPGIGDPMYAKPFSAFDPGTSPMTLRFFSNRVPGITTRLFMEGSDGFFVTDPNLAITPGELRLPGDIVGTPEPAARVLLSSGLAALLLLRRRRAQRSS